MTALPGDPKALGMTGRVERLISAIQNAHAGELAAARAYNGHWRSVRDEQERSEVQRIEQDELDHRAQLADMLRTLGAKPRPPREQLMGVIGYVIAALCRVGAWSLPMFSTGWFAAMYGAGRFERANVGEYEHAARLAHHAGRPEWIDTFLHFAEVEWDHEAYFRAKAEPHWLCRVIPLWSPLPPRTQIRESFARWQSAGR